MRDRPELAHYRPRYADPDRPDASATLVRTPSGADFDVADPALGALLEPGVRVIKQNRGVFDTMPLSLVTTQTLASLGRLVGTSLAPERFRPNLLVDALVGARERHARLGVYGSTVEPGRVTVGDPVELEPALWGAP